MIDVLKKQRLGDHCPVRGRLLQSEHHAKKDYKGIVLTKQN